MIADIRRRSPKMAKITEIGFWILQKKFETMHTGDNIKDRIQNNKPHNEEKITNKYIFLCIIFLLIVNSEVFTPNTKTIKMLIWHIKSDNSTFF